MTVPALFAVLGDPIAHSRSPAMHMAAFAALGLPHCYVACRVTAAELPAALAGARVLGFRGLNLTVPHKAAGLALLDEVEDRARRIGAVNTVVVEDGRLRGLNTDAPGFLDALAELPGPVVRRTVVLGGGGAARAIVDALRHAEGPAEVAWVSRRPEALPLSPGVRPTGWEALEDACRGVDLVVNATTVGMAGGPPVLPRPVPFDLAAAGARVVDAVYPRPPGGLLDAAAAAGLVTQDGLPMLLWQGVRALSAWLGRDIPESVVAAMRAALSSS